MLVVFKQHHRSRAMLAIPPLSETVWSTIRASLEPIKHIGSLVKNNEDGVRRFLGIVWHVLHSGTTWAALRPLDTAFEAAYRRFLRWSRLGLFEAIFQASVPQGTVVEGQIDSTSSKVHRAAYGKGGSIGRSRGGANTKIHGLCDGLGRWIRLLLSPGQHADIRWAPALVDGIPMRHLVADKGYDSKAFREHLAANGTTPVIPSRSTNRVQIPLDKAAYRRRHVVENGWLWLKDHGRIALRRDKLDATFLAFIHLAAAVRNAKLVP